jgi:CheY-like chemotaxis protein
MSDSTAQATFLSALRHVLRNLYDPAELSQSPLIRLFGVAQRGNPVLAVRQMVTSGIQALKPGDDVPPAAPAWRIYQVLAHCYIEQSSQTIVAHNLGLSVRQLRRQQREAEQTLADYLWAHHHLAAAADGRAPKPGRAEAAGDASPPPAAMLDADGRQGELDWLSQSLASETVDVAEVLAAAVKLTAPLAQRYNVRLECDFAAANAPIVGRASLLRQALLNLLVGASSAVPGGRVCVSVAADPAVRAAVIRVTATAEPGQAETDSFSAGSAWTENLAMARQLIGLFGGRLELSPTLAPALSRAVTLLLSPVECCPVLVIDDNMDTLRLFERYLSETRYRFFGVRDPEQAQGAAAQIHPRAVVLDVMLPGMDGWELLGRLREHPEAGQIPVIVCTILPQEPLALALGAAAFLRKPISREALLAALDRQIAPL